MSGKIVQLREAEIIRNATSGRLPNNVYRIREHLTEAEVDKLLGALKRNRHGHRDEINGLKLLRRQQAKNGSASAYVFVNERHQPFGRMGIGRMIERAGEAAGLPFPVRPHAQAFHWIRPRRPRNGYQKTPALPRPRIDFEHGKIYSHEPGAIQGHMAKVTESPSQSSIKSSCW
jgi:hypothetical protein